MTNTNTNENIRKSTAIYRTTDNISNLKIRVKIKEVSDELTAHDNAKKIKLIEGETRIYSWQQKVYGKFEREFYKDKKNCVTDLERRYHQNVINLIQNDDVLFTYVNEDEFSLTSEGCVSNTKVLTELQRQVDSISSINEEQEFHLRNSDVFDYKESLIHSLKNPYGSYNFEIMHIMADLGEYVRDTWLKAEYVLCTIKYNPIQKLLIILPDFTSFEPYYIEIEGDTRRLFQYYIENASETIPTDIFLRENEILNKIASYQAKLKLQKIGVNFGLPQKNKLNVHLFIEILTARKFEYNDIFVQYFIDLPKSWLCKDPSTLKGTTHTSHSSSDDNMSYFGFPFEICLEYNIQESLESYFSTVPYIYFEVISKDSWARFRTEGLAYTILPVAQSGVYKYNLHCFRICPKGPYNNLRRFFIGDCSSYSDITWISIPKDFDDNVINKYGTDTVGTGELSIRVNVIHQSQDFMADTIGEVSLKREKFILENLNKSNLIKSIEEVVSAFKLAKKKMIEARKNV